MKTMTYSESREVCAGTRQCCGDCEEIVITRAGKEPAVIVSLAEYEALKETAYLLRSPENARRLSEGIAALEAGLGQEHDLIEP